MTQDKEVRRQYNVLEGYNPFIPEPHIVIPGWMTPQQCASVCKLYLRDSMGLTKAEFFRKVENYGDYCGLSWAGMFIGIEKDGYTHS